jgi:AcrR family transcriptional regulator
MPAARTRNAEATRADILTAARARFAADGYERTTLRAVAADAGIDPALVIRYFGSKQNLFAAAADFTIEFPDLRVIPPEKLAEALVSTFFAVWEQDTTFLALLRAAMTSATAAETMRTVFATQVAPALTAITPDHPAERAGLLGAFVIGLATTRYVLTNPAVAQLSRDDLIRWSAPVIRQLLTGPVDVGEGGDGHVITGGSSER